MAEDKECKMLIWALVLQFKCKLHVIVVVVEVKLVQEIAIIVEVIEYNKHQKHYKLK